MNIASFFAPDFCYDLVAELDLCPLLLLGQVCKRKLISEEPECWF